MGTSETFFHYNGEAQLFRLSVWFVAKGRKALADGVPGPLGDGYDPTEGGKRLLCGDPSCYSPLLVSLLRARGTGKDCLAVEWIT